MKREPRLQFTDADLAEPKLEKPIRRVKKAEAKADKAQARIPKKTVIKKECGFDPAAGKVKTQLRFEEVDKKKPPSKLTHAAQDAPANLVFSQVHREIAQSEDDNVGVEAAHKTEEAVESGGRLVRSAHRAHQLKPYRTAIRAEKKLEQANIDALQKKAEIDSPTSNPVSKWQQRQAIKRQYAAAKQNHAAQTTAKAAENTAKAAKKAAEKAEEAGKYVWEHRRGFAIAAAILLMLAFLLNGLSSCSVLMDGVGSGIAASTYPSQDADMLGAEAQYCAMEAELQRYLDTYESTHDYDEYHFDLDSIEHDPYVLISILTALHQGEWKLEEVQGNPQYKDNARINKNQGGDYMTSDGSIVFKASIDDKNAQTKLNQLKDKIQRLQISLEKSTGEQSNIKKKLDSAKAAAQETEKEIKRIMEALQAELALNEDIASGKVFLSDEELQKAAERQDELVAKLKEQQALLKKQDSTVQSLGKQYDRKVMFLSFCADTHIAPPLRKNKAGEMYLRPVSVWALTECICPKMGKCPVQIWAVAPKP